MSHRAIGQQFDPEGSPGFEDGGQGYLWPSKMPDSGTTRGVEGMHLYRGVELTRGYDDPHEALDALVNAPARTALRDGVGHREPGATLGRHWTHDRDWAKRVRPVQRRSGVLSTLGMGACDGLGQGS